MRGSFFESDVSQLSCAINPLTVNDHIRAKNGSAWQDDYSANNEPACPVVIVAGMSKQDPSEAAALKTRDYP